MNWKAVSYDWNHIRAFMVTAEEGSLSAAARALGTTQPTLSRQVSALEEALDVTLFERGTRSMEPTTAGIELLDHVRVMADAAFQVSLTASGQVQSIDGKVTISCTGSFATHHLPAILQALRNTAPNIETEIVASNDFSDLRVREADIAVRNARPQHGDLIAKKVGDTTAHMFAALSYLDERGRPEQAGDLVEHDFIGFDDPTIMLRQFNLMGIPLKRDQFKLNTRDGMVILELMRHGLGIGIMSKDVARLHPELEILLPDFMSIDVPYWLVTHRELRTSRRIRVVFDAIADYCHGLTDTAPL